MVPGGGVCETGDGVCETGDSVCVWCRRGVCLATVLIEDESRSDNRVPGVEVLEDKAEQQ